MKVFISYSHKDEDVLKRLHTHLAVMIRKGEISEWFDRKILPGGELDEEIMDKLLASELFLPIVSPDFLASKYCYEVEMKIALSRCRKGEMLVVPIIVEPCDWTSTPLGKLKGLPKDGKAVALWDNKNSAFDDVVKELRRLINSSLRKPAAVSKPSIQQANGKTQVELPEAIQAPQRKTSRYRAKKTFSESEKIRFKKQGFAEIRQVIKSKINEIATEAGIDGHFEEINSNRFIATVENLMRDNRPAHITVYSNEGRGLGDISILHERSTSDNSANGFIHVGANDYELFFKVSLFDNFGREHELNANETAELLWEKLLKHAEIDYD